MNLNYDPKADSLYLALAGGKYDRSKKISEDVLVDFDKNGKVLGVEVLSAKKTIPSFIPGKAKISWGPSAASV